MDGEAKSAKTRAEDRKERHEGAKATDRRRKSERRRGKKKNEVQK